MKKQKIKINIKAAKKALLQGEHVEYFFYCFLKSLKCSSGKIPIKQIDFSWFNKNTIIKNLKTNYYFNVTKDSIFLRNYHQVQPDDNNYVVEFNEITRLACRKMFKKKNVIKSWDSTNIKYFLLSVVACHKEHKVPYALSLIQEDTGQSISTIQRALKTFDVERSHTTTLEKSPRCYHSNGNRINLTANFNKMPVGRMRVVI